MSNPKSALSPSRLMIWGVMVWGLAAGPAPAQVAPPNLAKGLSAVRDSASLFGAEAVQKATAQIHKTEQSYHVPVTVETVDSLRGESIDEVAIKEARKAGVEGIFILLAKREAKIEVLVAQRFREVVTTADALEIRNAFISEFRLKNFDRGLEEGVQKIDQLLAKAKEAGKVVAAPRPAQADLVLRNQVRLTLKGARKILEGAEAKAKELGVKANIAVVDDGGHLIAFERMDGARPASGYTATTKAVSAATFRAATGPIPAGATNPDPLLNLSLQNAATASGGKITTLSGGIPVVIDGQVVAAVGVGGGTGEQDAQVARAGVEGFLADVEGKAPAGK